MVYEWEVYGTASNGSRHSLGIEFCTTKEKAVNKTKRHHPGYTRFSAQKGEQMTKNRWYKEMHNIYQDWSIVSR